MNSMTAFMNHGSYIMHLACSIHKNKWSASFWQWTVITTGSFTFPAFKVKPVHFSFVEDIQQKWIHFIKTMKVFFEVSSSAGLKGFNGVIPVRLGFCIPWP